MSRKLTPIIGAVNRVRSGKPLSNRTMDEIHRALAENLVTSFADQAHHPHNSISRSAPNSAICIFIPAAPHEGRRSGAG